MSSAAGGEKEFPIVNLQVSERGKEKLVRKSWKGKKKDGLERGGNPKRLGMGLYRADETWVRRIQPSITECGSLGRGGTLQG